MELDKETQLAYEIADILNDRKSIDLHIAFCKRHAESYLKEKLKYVLSRPDIENRAAYYTSIVKRNDKNIGR
jgi:hypothetical protein